MQKYREQALLALKIYCKRSFGALEALKAGNFERVERFLKRKSAAFHNFRAIDDLANRAGLNLADDELIKAAYKDLVAVDQKLAKAMEAALEHSRTELSQVQRLRTHLSRYRSGNTAGVSFQQSV